MSNANYRVIDLERWPRKAHCAVFRNSFQPQYCISFDLDVAHFYRRAKEKEWPFYLAMIYVVAECAGAIENFRYRFEEGDVVLYDEIGTSFTYLEEGGDLFKQVCVPMRDSIEEYIHLARETIENQKEYFIGPPGNDAFVFSAIPWISFNHVSHTYFGDRDNACPIFNWGKFTERDGRLVMPFSAQVHHSFVDGVHLGRFAELLQGALDRI